MKGTDTRHSNVDCVNNSSETYHGAIDGQGAVTQLLDPVVSFYVCPLSAPLDRWGRVSSHLAVQDRVAAKWFNPVRGIVTFEDGRLWEIP